MNARPCHLALSPGMTLSFGMSLSRGMIFCLETMVLDGDHDQGTASVAAGVPLEEVCFGHRQVLAAPGKPRPAARASALPPALTTATPPHWHARTSPTFPA